MGEERETHKLTEGGFGEVHIADEVVRVIASMAASEVEGVAAGQGSTATNIAEKFGYKNLAKGVKVDVLADTVTVDISLILEYGYNVLDVSAQVQEKVKTALESMTGLNVSDVNVRISGVNMGTGNE